MRQLLAATLLLAPLSAHAAMREWHPARFDRIEASGSYDVSVVQGPVGSVRAEGDADAIGRLEVKVDGTSLQIGTKRERWGGRSHRGRVHMTVVSPLPLRAASLAGSGNVTIATVDTPSFEGSVAGSGNMVLQAVSTRQIALSVAGSGNLSAAGHSDRVSASIAGSGDVRTTELRTAEFVGDIAGSGNIDGYSNRTATLSIMGSGDARVRGGAKCTVAKMGSGHAVCTG